MSANIHVLIGNVGRDPESKTLPGGQTVATFSLATSRSWKDKSSGEWQEKTTWHNIVAWGPLAERVAQKVTKGAQVYVTGSVEGRAWEGKDGQKRTAMETVATDVQVLGPKAKAQSAPAGKPEDDDDSIPF